MCWKWSKMMSKLPYNRPVPLVVGCYHPALPVEKQRCQHRSARAPKLEACRREDMHEPGTVPVTQRP